MFNIFKKVKETPINITENDGDDWLVVSDDGLNFELIKKATKIIFCAGTLFIKKEIFIIKLVKILLCTELPKTFAPSILSFNNFKVGHDHVNIFLYFVRLYLKVPKL